MLPCLITNEVCSNTSKKCKACTFDSCKEVIKMNEEQMKYEERDKLIRIKKLLPEQCKSCSFLEVINLDKKKVYCPYLIKNECLIGSINKYERNNSIK